MPKDLIYPTESYAITGACLEVYKYLGNGFLECVYQECLEIEFNKRHIPFTSQKQLSLNYQGHQLRRIYKTDFVCYDKIIVELKAVSAIAPEHKSQVLNYLKATGYELGLIYNFGHFPLLEQHRVANTKKD